MRLNPLDDRLIVHPIPPEEVTESGLIIPVQAQSQQNIGKVLEVGPDAKGFKAGDYILFGRYSGISIEYNEEECIVLKRSEVLCLIEDYEAEGASSNEN